jgi:hypothetical protein
MTNELEPSELRFGEVLVFNQKLVHQSGRNISEAIRFSIQVRFSDLCDSEYAARRWPSNHKVTTDAFADPSISLQELSSPDSHARTAQVPTL